MDVDSSWQAELRGASTVLAASAVALLVVAALAPASAAERAAADPLLAWWTAPCRQTATLALAVAASWWWRARPDRHDIARAWQRAAIGALVATAALVALWWLRDGVLPAFIPSEESARPGMALGVAAGVLEEAIFRFALLAPVVVALARRGARRGWTAAAIVATALAFAMAHEVGPAAGPFDPGHFLARALVAGAAMSWAFVAVGPAFLLGLHVGAHVVLALLFVGG